MTRRAAWGALFALWLAGRAAGAAEVETLRQSGPPADRFNIAVLGDGYRAVDQTKLKTDAQGIIDYLFSVSPLAQYGQFFNVKLVHVISNDNGADNGSYGATRDTALGAYFNCGGIDRLLCIDDGAAVTAAARDVPEFNFAIVIVNDPKYGGSGGPVCASSSNEDSFEVLAHEIGHSLARLADEYSYEGNQPPCSQEQDCSEANVTLRTARDELKWKDWLDPTTPVPTPATAQYDGITGLFEGARYTPTGIYRSQLNCRMRDLGANYCPVCTEQFVRSIWTADNVKMVESTSPSQPNVESATCDPIELSVASPPIVPSTYRYAWSVDGEPQPELSRQIQLMPGAMTAGEHQVVVAIEDATALVRTDPNGILKDQFSWTVSVTKGDCPISGGGAAGAGGGADGGKAGQATGGASGATSSGGSAGDVGGAASGATTGNGGAASGSGPRPTPPPREASGCGCSMPGHGSNRAALSLAVLAVGVAVRRRRRSAC